MSRTILAVAHGSIAPMLAFLCILNGCATSPDLSMLSVQAIDENRRERRRGAARYAASRAKVTA